MTILRMTALSTLLPVLLLFACSVEPAEPPAEGQFPTIYGQTDIHEPFAFSDAEWAARAAEFSVAVFDASALDESDPSNVRYRSSLTVASRVQATTGKPLCAGEEFAAQPALAACSGVLIAEDLVLTAGHCTNGCSDLRFVFNYALTSAGTLPPLTEDDVYRCSTTVAEHDDRSGTDLDYSVLRLTRPVVNRAPAPVRASTAPMAPGTELVMSGYPWRMPLKVTDNGFVRSHHASGGHFVTNLDAFRGNSGSGVFDATTRELVGILVRGDQDFVFDGACYSWNRCSSDDGCRGEDVMYVHHALQDVCSKVDAPFCEPGGGDPVCPFELGDCDGDASNGCETPLLFDSSNCGACNEVCGPGSVCEDGACLDVCEPDTADCDGDTNNACETNVLTNPNHCAACGVSCPATAPNCVNGACVP